VTDVVADLNEKIHDGLENPKLIKAREISEGLLRGVLRQQHLDNLEECLNESEDIIHQAEDVYQLLSEKTLKSFTAGTKKIAAIVQEMSDELSKCKESSSEEIDKLKAMSKLFKSPLKLAYKIGKSFMINGVEILEEAQLAQEAYKDEKWHDFGMEIGNAVALTFFGKVSVEEMKVMYEKGESDFPVSSFFELDELVPDYRTAVIDELKANQIATNVVQGFLAGADIQHTISYTKLNLCMIKSKNA